MKSQILEARVLNIVETVLSGARVEDSRVELKADWPTDMGKSARQIAGLANAGAGDDVLWIVGVDEERGAITIPRSVELQEWWGQVARRFSEVSPELQSLVVPLPGGGTVTVLRFETTRAPYLVTTNGHGGVEREVPWREGNSTRSARRSELLRTVVGEARVPQFELIEAWVEFENVVEHPDGWDKGQKDPEGRIPLLRISGRVRAFVEGADAVVLPEHKWTADLAAADLVAMLNLTVTGPRQSVGSTMSGMSKFENRGVIEYVPGSGLHVRGSDTIVVMVRGTADVGHLEEAASTESVRLHMEFPLALSKRIAVLDVLLQKAPRHPGGGQPDLWVSGFTHDGQVKKSVRY